MDGTARKRWLTYPGNAIKLSNFSNTKRMQVCLNDMALKASDKSYISETFSTDISFRENNITWSTSTHIQEYKSR